MASGEQSVAPPTRRSPLRRATAPAIGLLFALLALVTAPLAALVSRMAWRPGGATVPYGLVLSAAASMGVVVLARAVSRRHAFVAAAAWLVGLGVVMRGSPGGGFLIASDTLGWSFLVVATVVVIGSALLGGSGR
ncbi:MAG: hypothetical protein QOI06_3441 [Nocardioidaceae bacterium]|jgi:hypothetical protein|nr:hypothetical protein [Nocardioidaceae bacterium]